MLIFNATSFIIPTSNIYMHGIVTFSSVTLVYSLYLYKPQYLA